MKWMALLFGLLSFAAHGQVRVAEPWTRATPPGAKIGAGYMKIMSSAGDRLLGASSPAAARIELHITEKKGEVMRMREIRAYDIPAGGSFELSPGGAHLMLVDLKAPFKEGTKVPITLRFEKAGAVKVELQVRALGASHPMH
jgi:periplasmic copper chaperone A